MKPSHIQILGLCLIAAGFVFVVFIYSSAPRSLAEVATKSQVAIGTYEVNKVEFDRGRTLFASGDYSGARAAFLRADPEKRDAAAQFLTAYSFYRQGWGRFTNDDVLFTAGVQAAALATQLDPTYRTSDESLQLKTPSELKTELEEGLKITASDFDPRRLARERK
jgi:hypothetical protein